MAKDRKKLQHIHSSIADKQPTPQTLEVGEIAVNNSKDQEFLSIKNTDDKVVRFSSDGQIINWIERKEVMPYVGYVRGDAGPSATSGDTPTADAMGSYGISNDDLLNNTSEIVIKLNQVAASATTKHNKVNGAKDRYNKLVNPTTDSGVNDGAGFFIDMSRYAMRDGNPSFSSVTVTDKTSLYGNTTIANGRNIHGTDSGTSLTILTDNVTSDNKIWNETILAKTETISSRNTTVGTESLHVSGTTTEVHDSGVTITNNSDVTETTKGNVVENVSGTTTINHSGTTTTNESGDTIFNTTGSTTIQSTGAGSDVTIYAKDNICEKADNAAAFVGAVKTNIGLNCEGNVTAQTLNVRANTADTRVTSAYTNVTSATTIANKVNTTISSAKTEITTATTTIAVANTSATTATLSGNTLDITAATVARLTTPTSELTGDTLTINESQSISAKTPTTTLSGTNLTINEANTVISSCTKVDIVTDDLNIKQCNAGSGTAEFDFCSGYTVNSNNITLQECDNNGGKIVIKENATDISGKTLTIRESGATDFSGGSLTAVVASAATVTVKGALTENVSGATTINHSGATNYNYTGATTLSGSSLASTTTGNTTFNVSGNTTINTKTNTVVNTSGTTDIISTGSTKIETNGKNNKVTVQSTGEGGDVEVFAADTLCTSGGTTAAFVGAVKTNIGMNCADGGNTATLNVRGTTTSISAGTITQTTSGATTVNVGGALTENVTGNTTINHAGTTNYNYTGATTLSGSSLTSTTTGNTNINASASTCIQSTVNSTLGATGTTNIGTDCAGAVNSNYVNIYAKSGITETANTVTISGTSSVGVSGDTVGISGDTTNISGATTLALSGKTVNVDATDYDLDATNVCVSGAASANFYGKQTRIGVECGGGIANGTTIKGDAIDISGGTLTEVTSGKTCIHANTDLNLGGNSNTRIGYDCSSNSGYSDNVYVSASSSAITYAPNINISGGTVNMTGTTKISISGNTTNISGNTINVSGGTLSATTTDKICIQATDATNGVINIGGNKATNIGTDCAGTGYSDTVDIDASTSVTINTPKTNITGDTYLSGKTYFNNTCSAVTVNELSAALCEIKGRGEVTWKTGDYAATDENLKWYELWQNGAQIKNQDGTAVRIDIPKDHILKDASVVYGIANGSAFTACTEAVEDCHWYIKLVWNVYTSGHADDKITYIPADDLITDIDDKNPADLTKETSYNNIVADVWYENGQNWVSANTTTSIHVSQNLYADNAISGKSLTIKDGGAYISGNTNISGGTISLYSTGNTIIDSSKGGISLTSSGSTSITSRSNVSIAGTKETYVGSDDGIPYSEKTYIYASKSISAKSDDDMTLECSDILTAKASNVNITGNTYISGDTLNVTAYTKIEGSTTLIGSTKISGVTTVDGNLTVTGKTDISGETCIGKTLEVKSGLTKSISFTSGSYGVTGSPYNGSGDTTVSIPKNMSDIQSRGSLTLKHNAQESAYTPGDTSTFTFSHDSLTWSYGSVCNSAGDSYNTNGAKSFTIPKSLSDVSCGYVTDNGTCITFTKPICVPDAGTVTAGGAIYSSDRTLKENIVSISDNEALLEKAANIDVVSFNFKNDESKNTKYGVIAQDIQEIGLGELVHDANGKLGVDYTSLLMLKIAYLENTIKNLTEKIEKLEK